MKLTEEEIHALRQILKAHQVNLAYVFGSYAHDSVGPLSDFDLAIVFNEQVARQEYFNQEALLALAVSKIVQRAEVDIVNLDTAEKPLLKHRAVFHGQCIFSQQPRFQFKTERNILREYEDTEFLRRVQRAVRRRHIQEGTFGKPSISIYRK